tara:strand:- start:197 stop:559 length:363 start_codon:yes stop_codon:yes gene_type:complete
MQSASASMIRSLPEIIKTDENSNKAKNISDQTLHKDLNEKSSLYPLLVSQIGSVLDGRARTTDPMLLIILIDIFYGSKLSLYLFAILALFLIAKFILSLVAGVRKKWVEKVIKKIIMNLR